MDKVESHEIVARYILCREHVRSNFTVKQDAFVPHPHTDLSVTRHLLLSEVELWAIGHAVAMQRTARGDRNFVLQGRADVKVSLFEQEGLKVAAAPLPENATHANVHGWPQNKPAQKIIAQHIACAVGQIKRPPSP